MKRIAIIVFVLLSVAIGSTAILNQEHPNNPYFPEKDLKSSKLHELPDHIYSSFNQSNYSNWEVYRVYKVSGKPGKYEYYEIRIRKAGENKDLIYDRSGKLTIVHW